MERKFANIQNAFDFLSVLIVRDHSKWWAKQKRTCRGDNAHPNVRSEWNKSCKKKTDTSWNHWSHCRTNWIVDH